jgi:RimJ/RimL family protein N-acetyltransferase
MISFSELHSDHFSLMHHWFNKPHVQRYYSLRDWTEEEVFQKLLPYIAFDKGVHGFVIGIDEYSMGYIQYYFSYWRWLEEKNTHRSMILRCYRIFNSSLCIRVYISRTKCWQREKEYSLSCYDVNKRPFK